MSESASDRSPHLIRFLRVTRDVMQHSDAFQRDFIQRPNLIDFSSANWIFFLVSLYFILASDADLALTARHSLQKYFLIFDVEGASA